MEIDGILLIDKEPGWTSHDVVARARRLTGQRKIGHTGTLDPLATGLLVLCLGRATRLVEYMTRHDKRYEGTIALGSRTATDDAEGDVLETRPAPDLGKGQLRELESRFTGNLMQRPPAYSAVKVGGQRAYAVARRGGSPAPAERPVIVHSLVLEQTTPGQLLIRVHCGPGTYVRSLARDIGETLGCGAHLAALRRTASGTFRVEDAIALGRLAEVAAAGQLDESLLPPDEGMTDSGAAILTVERGRRLCHGISLEPAVAATRPASIARAYTTDGTFLGVASVEASGQIQPRKMFQT